MQISSSTPLIVTGHRLGGSIASLFTISLFNNFCLEKNRLLCITYGFPLVGDKNLYYAISRSTIWNSCFLNAVSINDLLPWLFSTNDSSSSPAAALSPQTNAYMPFGTFLFCSDKYTDCSLGPDPFMDLVIPRTPIPPLNQGFQFPDSVLESSVSLPQQQQQNIDINTLKTKMETLITIGKRFYTFEKLKKDMAQLECNKKCCKDRNIGYYDSYKNKDMDFNLFDVMYLWQNAVEEAKIKAQKGGAPFRRRWLYAGTSYRRMVEPLAIARYYRNGGKDYVTKNRLEHFVLLEEWFKTETTKSKTSNVAEAFLTLQPSYYLARIEKDFLPQSLRFQKFDDYHLSSEEESDEHVNETCKSIDEDNFSFKSLLDNYLLSSKGSVLVEEKGNNFITFGEFVDKELLSGKGSVLVEEKGNNFITFGERVDKDLLSGKGSVLVEEKGNNFITFGERVDKDLLSDKGSVLVEEKGNNFITFGERVVEEKGNNFITFAERVDKDLLSDKGSVLVEEKGNNFITFGERVDKELLSGKGSVLVEENRNNFITFGERVDKELLSGQGPVLVEEKGNNFITFEERLDKYFVSSQGPALIEEKKNHLNRLAAERRKMKYEDILTTDSCFWAHVEEALLSCKELKVNKEKEETLKKLVEFENYVYGLLQNYEVSSEIFLRRSSFMRWWNEYKAIKGTAYFSQLANFMKDPSKHVQYASGAYEFPNSLES